MKRLLALTTAAATAALALGTSSPAHAAKPDRVLATPSAACNILQQFGASGYASFGACMGNLHQDMAAFRFPSDEDPSVLLSLRERCAGFEQEGLTYPFTFEEGPDWPFPVLTAQNRQQCATTLYVYHTLADALGG
jgi:hypothetical protein